MYAHRRPIGVLEGHTGPVFCVRTDSVNSRVYSIGNDNTIMVWYKLYHILCTGYVWYCIYFLMVVWYKLYIIIINLFSLFYGIIILVHNSCILWLTTTILQVWDILEFTCLKTVIPSTHKFTLPTQGLLHFTLMHQSRSFNSNNNIY